MAKTSLYLQSLSGQKRLSEDWCRDRWALLKETTPMQRQTFSTPQFIQNCGLSAPLFRVTYRGKAGEPQVILRPGSSCCNTVAPPKGQVRRDHPFWVQHCAGSIYTPPAPCLRTMLSPVTGDHHPCSPPALRTHTPHIHVREPAPVTAVEIKRLPFRNSIINSQQLAGSWQGRCRPPPSCRRGVDASLRPVRHPPRAPSALCPLRPAPAGGAEPTCPCH